MFLGTYAIDEYVNIPAVTHRFSSGEAYAPTSISYTIYEEGSTSHIDENVDMTPASPFDGVVGLYYARRQLTAAAGFEAGKTYVVVIKATVDSVSAIDVHLFQIRAIQSGDSYARLGAPAGASVSADVAAVKGVVDTIQADTDLLDDVSGGLADIHTDVAAVKSDTAAILADTGTDGVVVAAASKTGYSLTATTGLGNQTANITGTITTTTNLTNAPSDSSGITTLLARLTETRAGYLDQLEHIHDDTDGAVTKLNTIIGYLDTEIAAILADTNELQTDLVNGGRLDLLIDAIKAKTDSLNFTVAGKVNANVLNVNGTALTGNGSAGTPWGPA